MYQYVSNKMCIPLATSEIKFSNFIIFSKKIPSREVSGKFQENPLKVNDVSRVNELAG